MAKCKQVLMLPNQGWIEPSCSINSPKNLGFSPLGWESSNAISWLTIISISSLVLFSNFFSFNNCCFLSSFFVFFLDLGEIIPERVKCL
mgnify:CR=1 FL=1